MLYEEFLSSEKFLGRIASMDAPPIVQEPAHDAQKAEQSPQNTENASGAGVSSSSGREEGSMAVALVILAVLAGIGLVLFLSVQKADVSTGEPPQPKETANGAYMDYVVDSAVTPLTSNVYLDQKVQVTPDKSVSVFGILLNYGGNEKPDIVVGVYNMSKADILTSVSSTWMSEGKVKGRILDTGLGKGVYCMEDKDNTSVTSIYCLYIHGKDVVGIWSVLPEKETIRFVKGYVELFPSTDSIGILENIPSG